MQQHKKIAALFFLSIFSMLMLHQMLPHAHHQHADLRSSVERADHHDHHRHQHQHDGEKDDSTTNWLGFLLEGHAHTTYHSSDFHKFENAAQQLLKHPNCSAYVLVEFLLLALDDHGEQTEYVVHPPPDHSTHPYLATLALRGPPVLG